jgi:hypothetical protein
MKAAKADCKSLLKHASYVEPVASSHRASRGEYDTSAALTARRCYRCASPEGAAIMLAVCFGAYLMLGISLARYEASQGHCLAWDLAQRGPAAVLRDWSSGREKCRARYEGGDNCITDLSDTASPGPGTRHLHATARLSACTTAAGRTTGMKLAAGYR